MLAVVGVKWKRSYQRLYEVRDIVWSCLVGLSHVDSILRRRGREGRVRVGYIDFGETIENLNTCRLWL